MNVNFIKQIRLIMEYGKRNKLSSHERMFYIALFYCANQCAMATENQDWPEEYFPVSNSELNGWTGFDERAIRNLRNSLKNRGLIDFKKGDGKKRDPVYRFFYLSQIGYKIAPDIAQTTYKNAVGKTNGDKNAPDNRTIDSKFAPDTVGDTVGDSVGDNVVTDCEFAPDSGLSSYSIKNKSKKENENKRENIKSNPIESTTEDMMRYDADAISPDIVSSYEERIKKNIDYDGLLITHPFDIRMIDEMVELIAEQMLSMSDVTLIAGQQYPTAHVKRKFLKLNYSHIEYVLECLKKNTTDVRNIKKYLLAALFNAPSTIDGYYDAAVRHDMPELAAR